MFKRTALAILAALIVFAGYVATLPNDYRITRETAINAPATRIFEHVNDFHKWQAWSPWAKKDPSAKATFEGPTSGQGASFMWDGNDDVGAGRMTIRESKPNELIRIDLEFIKPWAGLSPVVFTFTPEGDQTRISWSISGRAGFLEKAICVFMDMDKMVGGDFEAGLATLKGISEGWPTLPEGK